MTVEQALYEIYNEKNFLELMELYEVYGWEVKRNPFSSYRTDRKVIAKILTERGF